MASAVNISRSNSFSKKTNPPKIENFACMKKLLKNRIAFCKNVSVILQERSQLEDNYAKGLQKLGKKLQILCQTSGSGSAPWLCVGRQMENESVVHRYLSSTLYDKSVRQLLAVTEDQSKARKSLECAIGKLQKKLYDARNAEMKLKKECFSNNRRFERLLQLVTYTSKSSARNVQKNNEKHALKLRTKTKRLGEILRQSEHDYFTSCLRAERCRYELFSSFQRASDCFLALEQDRQECMEASFYEYQTCLKDFPSRMENVIQNLCQCEFDVNMATSDFVQAKMNTIIDSTLVLPDFYAEDIENPMNKERRIQSLRKVLFLLNGNIQKEEENLQKELTRCSVPFLDYFQTITKLAASKDDDATNQRLHRMQMMLIYLEATKYKIQKVLNLLENATANETTSILEQKIQTVKDNKGIQQSTLNLHDCYPEDLNPFSIDENGGENGALSEIEVNFEWIRFPPEAHSNDGKVALANENERSNDGLVESSSLPLYPIYRVLYDYQSDMPDELQMQNGDVVQLLNKLTEDWWQGKLNDVVGLFPAAYVEEINDLHLNLEEVR